MKRRVGRLAYELDFPDYMRIHLVISMAHLSPSSAEADPFDRAAPPPELVEDS